jgi:hypothetical protein
MPLLAIVTAVRDLFEAALRDAESIPVIIAPIVFDLAFDNTIRAAVVAHPSLLKPEDFDVRHSQTSSYTS